MSDDAAGFVVLLSWAVLVPPFDPLLALVLEIGGAATEVAGRGTFVEAWDTLLWALETWDLDTTNFPGPPLFEGILWSSCLPWPFITR